jgi:hypothetical protein
MLLGARVGAFGFSSLPDGDNTKMIPENMLEREKKLFQERVSEKDKKFMEANRLASMQLRKEFNENENAWWNQLRTISEVEYKLMPMGFIKKYGSYINNIRRYAADNKLEENKKIADYYAQVKHLKNLLTDEEKKHLLIAFKKAHTPDVVRVEDLIPEDAEYMKRQPRVEPEKLSYNFEQYRRYTKMITTAKQLDDAKSERFYKLVKYVKANQESNPSDNIVKDFVERQGLRPDLIEIPEEFADLDLADVRPDQYRRKAPRKKIIRSRTDRSLVNFDAWRCHDRRCFVHDPKHPTTAVLHIAPCDLVKVFGRPCEPTFGDESTGEYLFEDNNLDMYYLFDYKQTDLFYGLNRDDEYYTSPKNTKKPLHQRKRKWPSIQEFWDSDELMPFRLIADDQADVRKFKRWFKLQLRKADSMEQSFDDQVLAKYGSQIDVCLGDFNEKGVLNTDMAVYQLDWTQFMSKQELKEYKGDKLEPLVKPKMFDLSKAKRVKTTREEIKMRELARNAEAATV